MKAKRKIGIMAAIIAAFAVCFLSAFPDVASCINIEHAIEGVSLAALSAPLYFDRQGMPYYGVRSSQSQPVNGEACVCDRAKPYMVPEFITLTATSTGVGSLAKFTPFDDIAEAVQGTLGTIFFGVAELPFGAGTIARQDGTLIFGQEAIRQVTATRMLAVDYFQMTGTDIAGVSQQNLNYVRGFISGNDNTLLKATLLQSNQTAVLVLRWDAVSNGMAPVLMWKSNEGFQYVMLTALGVINIAFHLVGFNYYGV